jgi:hypothetical protein
MSGITGCIGQAKKTTKPSAHLVFLASLLEDLHLWPVQRGGQVLPLLRVEALGAVLQAHTAHKQGTAEHTLYTNFGV